MRESRKSGRLSAGQADLLREVLQKRAPSELATILPRALANRLGREERERVSLLIGAEFAETGLDADSEPLPRGLKLEELLDVINRPNLCRDINAFNNPGSAV